MDNMTPVINIVTRVTVIIMAGLVMGWALHHETRAVTLGMTLGLLAGLVNFRYLALKVRRVTEAVAKQGKSSFSLGFATRISFGILVTMFSVKYEHFSLEATIIGLFIPQLLAIPVGIYLGIKNKL
ncbi:ATP synthase I [Paenibacillus sp. FSL R7-277]|uniref:ATP synthase subunit I n=1 Tax=Paenibacillus sp. FSL R7-277 TaxID=1227352 RepID=UPI0003E1D751|nr:ATP synthase subunit I [Paenibacillus sp. FSL R7-277]ETT79504.1 ATP synthase I [Paenibacillus sp. FSL R7-277]